MPWRSALSKAVSMSVRLVARHLGDRGRVDISPTRKTAVGRQCEYAVFGCRSFNRDPLPLEAGHLRTTAVAVADFLGGVSEGQISG
jgi:hypothetical protein